MPRPLDRLLRTPPGVAARRLRARSSELPPGVEPRRLGHVDPVADPGNRDRDPVRGGRDEQALDGLGPGVGGQHERAPVDRQQQPAPEQPGGLDGLLRVEVDVVPRGS